MEAKLEYERVRREELEAQLDEYRAETSHLNLQVEELSCSLRQAEGVRRTIFFLTVLGPDYFAHYLYLKSIILIHFSNFKQVFCNTVTVRPRKICNSYIEKITNSMKNNCRSIFIHSFYLNTELLSAFNKVFCVLWSSIRIEKNFVKSIFTLYFG